MRTSIIKVLVLFQMSVRELKLEVKQRRMNKKALKDPNYLMERLIIKNRIS